MRRTAPPHRGRSLLLFSAQPKVRWRYGETLTQNDVQREASLALPAPTYCGAGGAKGGDQGECGLAKHAPDSDETVAYNEDSRTGEPFVQSLNLPTEPLLLVPKLGTDRLPGTQSGET